MTRARCRAIALALALGLAPCPAFAQPGEPGDSVAVEYFLPEGSFARLGLAPYADLRWRLERVRDRPGTSQDLGLGRLTGRGGLALAKAGAPLRAEAGIRVTFGSDEPGDPWAPVLNETADTLALDRLALGVALRSGSLLVTAGKQRSPLRLSEMIWDDDLRPVGIAATARHDLGSTTTGRLALALFTRARFDMADARIRVAQVSASRHEDASRGADAAVSWIQVEGPDDLARDRLQRQNASVATPQGLVYAADFGLLDVQLGAHGTARRVPYSVRLDLVRNTTRASERDGLRLRVALGGVGVPAGLEAGWVFERLEREAVAGAFNSDDWWFHSRMSGHQVWLRAARGEALELRLAGFYERRDDLGTATRRLTAQLSARLPPR